MAATISALLGASLLVLGRKIFWLLVGAIGFGVGLQLTERLWPGPGAPGLLFGLLVGVVFALLAIFLQSVAIGVAGFFGGGYILLGLARLVGFEQGPLAWGAFILGGILGAILVGALFNWSLILLSSMVGASMIVNALDPARGMAAILLIGLTILGIVIQSRAFASGPERDEGET